jgi:DNA-binding NarL/FixJ family response regulator
MSDDVTRVGVVEDDPDLRETLSQVLAACPGMRCVAACATAEEAWTVLPPLQPQVVLMDVNLPGASGVECVRRLAPQLPECSILMLTIYDSDEVVFRALEAGAIGYLCKPVSPAVLTTAIHEARSGGTPMTAGIARRIIRSFQRPASTARRDIETTLAPRELETLRLLAKGLQYKEIAAELGIGLATVNHYTAKIYKKLQVQSRGQAVARYRGEPD